MSHRNDPIAQPLRHVYARRQLSLILILSLIAIHGSSVGEMTRSPNVQHFGGSVQAKHELK